jgi:non-ribosomal peptide synthase protein (TIGR01720 family)
VGIDVAAVRAHALAVLPAQLVPAALVPLRTLPVGPNGKLDRDALPAPDTAPRPTGRAPAGPTEQTLCELFAEVLGVPAVGVADGFFALGGDSIMAIQLAGRARAVGLELSPRDVFTAGTPEALALLARPAEPARAVPDPGVGTAPPTPVMRWWRDHTDDATAFTMSALLPVPPGTGAARLAAALRTLRARHGALRLRLADDTLTVPPPAAETPPGSVEPAPAEPARTLPSDPASSPSPLGQVAGPDDAVLRRVDVAGWDADRIRHLAAETAAATRIDPAAGDPLRAVWYDGGPAGGQLLLTVHHLAVDGVSWRILAAEWATLVAGGTEPPAPPVSFRTWARALAATDAGPELPYWTANQATSDAALLAPAAATPAAASVRRATLHTEVPASWLPRVLAGFRCGADDVLLTALLAAAVRWRGSGTALVVDREGHGRDELAGLDASGTVGWFTTQYPVRLAAADAGDAYWADDTAPGRILKQVKEDLRAVPAGGRGYGLLRYPASGAPRLGGPVPDVRFNHLGRFGTAAVDLLDAGGVPLTHPVEIDVATDDDRILATWSYDPGRVGESRIRALTDLWAAALAQLSTQDGGATASDFPLVALDQRQVEALELDLADELNPGDETDERWPG